MQCFERESCPSKAKNFRIRGGNSDKHHSSGPRVFPPTLIKVEVWHY